MRDKLSRQIQKGLKDPSSFKLPEDPFEGFREPLFPAYEGKGHVNRAAIQRNIDRRAERKLQALVQAANELHFRE